MTSSPDSLALWSPLQFPGMEETGRPGPPFQEDGESPSGWALPELQLDPPHPGPTAGGKGPASDDSYARGFAEGLQTEAARRKEELAAALAALGGASEALNAQRADLARDLGRCVHALAVAVAHKVIQKEIRLEPTIVRTLVDQALEMIPLNAPVVIHMNREDLEGLKEGPDAPASIERIGGVQLIADPELDRGSFLAESPMQIVDGRLEVALRALYDRLEYE